LPILALDIIATQMVRQPSFICKLWLL